MYYWRVFLWENGHKSTEYTKHVVAPIFIEDKLDETLDSGEVVLKAMPIATRNAFPPKTKFRLERYTTEDYTDEPRKWDFVVEHDDVEEYEGCPEICTHRVNLIEASVIAQGMHVDNIALTYELQDVDLNYETVEDSTGKVTVSGESGIGSASPAFRWGGGEYNGEAGHCLIAWRNGWQYTPDNPSITYYETTFKFEWGNTQGLKDELQELDCHESHNIKFAIPKLIIKCGNKTSWDTVGEAPTHTTVTYKKYKQRAKLGTDGKYERDDNYTREELESSVLVDKTSYPANGDSFVQLDGRTKVEGNYLYALAASSGTHDYRDPMYINATWDSMCDNAPLSYIYPSSHYDEIEFDTIALRDDETLSTDSNGNKFICWCEYLIEVREAFYGAGWTRPFTRQVYKATGAWTSTGSGTFRVSIAEVAKESFYSMPNSEPATAVKAAITVRNMTTTRSVAFLKGAEKYNCYNLLRKALLTCDTQILGSNGGLADIEYSIKIKERVKNQLIATTVYETTFEQKNLWEVLLQIGYYLHAIPYLEFTDDGTDRFELKFRQLGNTEEEPDTSRKITVFNSRNLSEYFTQYDSYVTNLFSPQNTVEEWLVPKTSDSPYLVSNDNAELQTKYDISEVVEFKIKHNGVDFADAINHIFEESIYSCLSVAQDMRPSKACTLFYKLGDNKIQGLTYVPPQSSEGNAPTALKKLVSWVLGEDTSNLKYNELLFYIKYRTQDTARITSHRPNLDEFIKNSDFEQYPHNEQYYGQQDKIIDSERFSANLFGQLIRVGNSVYQRQEYAEAGNEKESGDLVTINSDAYYVIATENEYYPDMIKQKVTYSKDFNQLSCVVTIPSEPRFYEVSERSTVRREVRINEFLKLSTTLPAGVKKPTFISGTWQNFVKNLCFTNANNVPNFAYTKFIADSKRHGGLATNLFPSSKVSWSSVDSSYVPHEGKDHSDCIVPVLHFPMKNSIIFEWDMKDNFSAGDCVDTTTSGASNTSDNAYFAMQSVRYCDLYGRADLFQFKLFGKEQWEKEQVRRLPYAELATLPNVYIESPTGKTIGLDKDNREAISFNYQINLLYSSGFVTYANLFGKKEGQVRYCLLNTRLSKFEGAVEISGQTVVSDGLVPVFTNSGESLKITFNYSGGTAAVRSILIYELRDNKKYPIMGKNVNEGEPKLAPWYIFPIFQADR